MSVELRHDLLEIFEMDAPAAFGAAERLLLVGAEADLFDAQQRSCRDGFEREGDFAVEPVGRVVVRVIPRIGEAAFGLDVENLAIDMADRKSTRLNSSH